MSESGSVAPEAIPGNHIARGNQEGFTIIADVDVAGSYEFDIVLVVRAPDDTLWAAHDSGCSCPDPFEDHTWPTDWVPIRQLADIEPVLNEWYHENVGGDRGRVRAAVAKALSSGK